MHLSNRLGLQYDGVVKADVGERPVHDHHLRVEDLSAQLQQAEHRTPVELYGRTGRRNFKKRKSGKAHKRFQLFQFNRST